jgi:hypothetical protein
VPIFQKKRRFHPVTSSAKISRNLNNRMMTLCIAQPRISVKCSFLSFVVKKRKNHKTRRLPRYAGYAQIFRLILQILPSYPTPPSIQKNKPQKIQSRIPSIPIPKKSHLSNPDPIQTAALIRGNPRDLRAFLCARG